VYRIAWLYFHHLLILVLITVKLLKTEEIAANDSFRKIYGLTCSCNASLSDEN